MSLIHPWLLLGLGLTAIPVILHLMLRATPKKLVFPALRLIQDRKRQNTQRLRLRHILLLLLRMAVIAAIALAIARPKVPAGDYRPSLYDSLRLLLVLGAATVVYFGLLAHWKRQKLPAHVTEHRRTLLRYATTAASILLFLLLVAWPYQQRVSASMQKPMSPGDANIPVAAVLVLDTSLSMQYRFENRTRFEIAAEIAARHLASLPSGSRAAVCDTALDAPIRMQTVAAGQTRLANLQTRIASRPFEEVLEAALQAQLEDREKPAAKTTAAATAGSVPVDEFAREIYVFTDLAASAWRGGEAPRLGVLLNQLPGLKIYFIDVGATEPQNVGLSGLSLSTEEPVLGSDLTVRAMLAATGGTPTERTVELYFENDAGKLVKRDPVTIRLDPANPAPVTFNLADVRGTVRQGELRIAASDPLEFDNRLSFTVQIHPPRKVLVVSDTRASAEGLMNLLAPPRVDAQYDCKFLQPAGLAAEPLKPYSQVWLVNVADPTPAGWKALRKFVEDGGGLGIALGSRTKLDAYSADQLPDAAAILPAEPLVRAVDPRDPVFLDMQDLAHPVMSRFQDWGVAELTGVEIPRYWNVGPVGEARPLVRFTNLRHSPALVVRDVGKGRALLIATAIDRNGWNDLPTAGWKYLAWMYEMARFLAQAGSQQTNMQAGSDVVVPLDPELRMDKYLLQKPAFEQLPGVIPTDAEQLVLHDIDQLGSYRVRGSGEAATFERGFSVNAAPQEGVLKKLTNVDLEKNLPKERFSISQSIEGLQREVYDIRIGRELYPFVVLMLALAFMGEQIVANRFYEK